MFSNCLATFLFIAKGSLQQNEEFLLQNVISIVKHSSVGRLEKYEMN